MIWRTGRGLVEPTPAAVIWMWALSEDAEGPGAREERPRAWDVASWSPRSTFQADPEAGGRRLTEEAQGALFDPLEFALLGGWAYLTGRVSRSVH